MPRIRPPDPVVSADRNGHFNANGAPKKAHDTQQAAQKHVDHMYAMKAAGRAQFAYQLVTYQCRVCSKWHIGGNAPGNPHAPRRNRKGSRHSW